MQNLLVVCVNYICIVIDIIVMFIIIMLLLLLSLLGAYSCVQKISYHELTRIHRMIVVM